MATQCITFWVVTKFITFSMATKFVPFRWRQCLSASELSFSLLCSWEFPDILKKSTKYPETLRSKDAEMRGHGCLMISLKRHKQRNETNTFELMAFFWHGNSASVRVQNRPKAFKALEKPSKHLERDPTLDVTLVCDFHDDRFLQTAQISLKRCRFPQISLKRLKTP